MPREGVAQREQLGLWERPQSNRRGAGRQVPRVLRADQRADDAGREGREPHGHLEPALAKIEAEHAQAIAVNRPGVVQGAALAPGPRGRRSLGEHRDTPRRRSRNDFIEGVLVGDAHAALHHVAALSAADRYASFSPE